MNKKSYVSISLAATILVVMTAAATAATAINTMSIHAKTPDGDNVCNDGHCSGMNAAIGWSNGLAKQNADGDTNGNDVNHKASQESSDD